MTVRKNFGQKAGVFAVNNTKNKRWVHTEPLGHLSFNTVTVNVCYTMAK